MPGRFILWYAFLGGPLAWTAHLLASYPLVTFACDQGSTVVLNLITLGTMLLSLAAAAAGWQALRRVRGKMAAYAEGEAGAGGPEGEAGTEAEEEKLRRIRFMALCGLWLGLLFTFVILVEGLPPLLQDPCAGVA